MSIQEELCKKKVNADLGIAVSGIFFSGVSGFEIRPNSQCNLGDFFFPNLKKKNPNQS